MRRLTRTVLVAAAVTCTAVVASCRTGSGQARPHALEPRGNPYVTTILLRDAADVFIYGVRRFRVLRDVTLRSFAPSVVPDGVEVLAVRASFLKSSRGRLTANGYPGAFCTDTWPPSGLGPTYEVDGLEVAAGDEVAFTAYVRATRPGEFVLDGYDLAYEDAGARHLRVEDGQRAEMTVLGPGDTPPRRPCDGSVRDVWTTPVRSATPRPS